MNQFKITSPCHPEYGLAVEMETVGRPYLTYESPSGFYCEAPTCCNQWDIHGEPINYQK